MNIKQLMIGDWVFNKHHNKPIQLTAYDYFTHSHKDGVQSFEGILNPHPTVGRDLEPIPLTEEILKLNGFIHKETMDEWWHEEYDPVWGMRLSDFELTDEFKFGRAKITYVHELQHALRLCGLNDLADNFKVNI